MARGRLLKTKTKEAYQIAKRAEAGRIQAQVEASKKKPLEVSIKEHIGKILDNAKPSDVVEIGTWLGLAWVIKPLIQTSALVIEQVQLLGPAFNKAGEIEATAIINQFLRTLPFGYELPMPKESPLSLIKSAVGLSEPVAWTLALVISGLIIKFGPALIQSLGGVMNMATMLLGGAVIGV